MAQAAFRETDNLTPSPRKGIYLKPTRTKTVVPKVEVYPRSGIGSLVTIFLIISLTVSSSVGADEAFEPNLRPTYDIPRLQSSIKIDGILDDSGWMGVPRATNFAEQYPDNGTRAPVETEVLLTYDDENLYIGFICYDTDAASIRSSLTDRDNIWSDDYMGFIFDTYGDGAWAYEIFTNPLGLQGDGRQVTSVGEDIGFDLVFESEGTITDTCYQVEIALPFSSIRFPDKQKQVWKATFWRTRPRESRSTSSWAFVDDDTNCWLCEFGTLTGIENVRPGRDLVLLPSVIGFQSAALRDDENPESGLKNDDPDGEASLGLSYSITSSLSAEATINPDFSQVESDAAQIDVNQTFALFYPEKRPFFQEGGDLFETWIDVVYTRAINNPSVAAKVVGRMGRTNIAYLGAHDEDSPIIIPLEDRSGFVDAGESYSNIFRLKQTFGGSSYIGGLFSDRRLNGDGNNTVYGVDGNLPFLKYYRFEAQVLGSYTSEPDDSLLTEDIDQEYFDGGKHTVSYDGESFGGHAFYASLERSSRFWNFDIDYWETGPRFRADNGFIVRNDRREMEAYTGLYFRPESRFLDRIEPGIVYGRVWNSRSEYKDSWLVTFLNFGLKAQTWVYFEYVYTREVFMEQKLPGMKRYAFDLDSHFSEPLQAGFSFNIGDFIARNEDPPVMGDGVNYSFWLEIKPLSNIRVEETFEFSKLKRQDNGQELFSGFVTRTRLNYQFTRELFLRLILQYDDFDEAFNIEPLLTYELNPFTVFYIGSGYNYGDIDDSGNMTLSSRQFFAKFQYLFRL
jgi:hypothetical protein